jgi:hypothetical protein
MPREAKKLDAVFTVASLPDIRRVLTGTVARNAGAVAKAM